MKKKPIPPEPKLQMPIWGWEIQKLIPDTKDGKRKIRSIEIVAAHTIGDVWAWLGIDLIDKSVEIVSITRFGPIIEILPHEQPSTT